MAEPTWDETEELAPTWDETEDVGGPAAEKPSEPWFEAGPVKIEKSPFDVNWGAAAAEEFSQPMDPSAKAALEGPLNYMAGSQAMGALSGKVAKFIGDKATNGVYKALNSKIPKKIADATDITGNVVGLGASGGAPTAPVAAAASVARSGSPTSVLTKDIFSSGTKIAAGGAVSAASQGAAAAPSAAKQMFGRAITYSMPGPLKYVQGMSDTARAVEMGQRGAMWLLGNAPMKLGKYAEVFSRAAASGTPQAVQTMEFILAQKDPEFQKIMKNERNNEQ